MGHNMELYDEKEAKHITNNTIDQWLAEEKIKCVPYSWILINHYQLKKYIIDKKFSEKQLEKEIIPFQVEIRDRTHPHVKIKEETQRACYRKQIAQYNQPIKTIEFEDGELVYLNLNEILTLVFNKSCTLNYKTRMLSDSSRREKSSSSIILDLNKDKNASVIRNSSEVDNVLKNIYAETIFRLIYAGKEENKPEWFYPYPLTAVDKEFLKNDTLKVMQSMQRQVVTKENDSKYEHLLDDSYKKRERR